MSDDTDLDWLLNDFAARVPQVTHAVAVSSDGLLVAATHTLGKDRADQLAAIAAGLVSLVGGADRAVEGGGVVSNVTEMVNGHMFLMAVSSGASLLVLASRRGDVGQVSYEMAQLINQVGPVLTPNTRGDLLIASDAPRRER